MGNFRLVRGLVIQIGERRFEFQRELEDRIQFEDIETGAFCVIARNELLSKIVSAEIKVLGNQSKGQGRSCDSKAREDSVLIAAAMSDKQRKRWQLRCEYVIAMRRRGVTRGSRKLVIKHLPEIFKQLGDIKPPSASSVLQWLKLYEESGGNNLSLVRAPTKKRSTSTVPEWIKSIVRQELRSNYFVRNGKSLTSVYVRILKHDGMSARKMVKGLEVEKPLVSLSTVQRLAQEIPAYERDRARMGPAAANAKWRHSTGGIYASRPLERVEMDHTELDLYVIDDVRLIPLGRPVVTILIDAYSGYILALYVGFDGESLGRLCRAIRLALSPKTDITQAVPTENEWITPGLWECLVVDNGLAFQSPQLRSIASALGCELEFCPVRKPWFKPHVERIMGSLTAILPTKGRPEKSRGISKPVDPVKDACVMFSDLCAALTKWAVDVHPFTINERRLDRPIDRLTQGLKDMPAPFFVASLDSLDLITGLSREVSVSHAGVEFLYLPYRSPELGELARQQKTPRFRTTIKYDPNDLGRIWVCNPVDDTWISVPCMYQDYASGLTMYQHKMIRANSKENLRSSGAYEVLLRSQRQLQDRFDVAVTKGKGALRNAKQQARYADMTSLRLEAQSPSTVILPAEKVITPEELHMPLRDIPFFEVLNLDHPGHQGRSI